MTHTPAPWCVSNDGNGVQEWRINAPNGDPALNIKSWDSMAVVYGNEDEQDKGNIVGLANARLIASAPDLLEALTDMLAGWRYIRIIHGDLPGVGWDRAEKAAVAAIAKSHGANS